MYLNIKSTAQRCRTALAQISWFVCIIHRSPTGRYGTNVGWLLHAQGHWEDVSFSHLLPILHAWRHYLFSVMEAEIVIGIDLGPLRGQRL